MKESSANNMIPSVVIHPDPRLRQVSAKVAQVDDNIRTEFDIIAQAMYHYQGIGLAGVQIGIMKKLFTVDHDYICQRTGDTQRPVLGKPIYMANAEIIDKSGEKIEIPDGCISVPAVYAKTMRHAWVKVKYLDYDGNEQIIEATGLLGACFQHEIDHTNGVLFFDYLSILKRKLLLEQYAKHLKNSTK